MRWLKLLAWAGLLALLYLGFQQASKIAVETKEGVKPASVERSVAQEAQAEAGKEDRRRAVEADMKLHPEKYPVSFRKTYHPDAKDIADMAKGTQTVGTAYSGSLWVRTDTAGGNYTAPAAQSVAASCGGGLASIAEVQRHNVFVSDGVLTDVYGSPTVPNPSAVWAAIQVWCPSGTGTGNVVVWAIAASAGGSPDVEYVVTGWFIPYGPPPNPQYWYGPTEITADFTLSLTGAYRKAEITQNLGPAQSGLRHPAQRTGTGTWWADASTTVTATCGTATATANYGVTVETEVGLGITVDISYNSAPAADTAYGIVTVNKGGGAKALALSLANWTFYKDVDSGGNWIWRGTTFEPGFSAPRTGSDVYWKTVPSGNTITIHRCAGGSGGVSLMETAVWNAGQYENHFWRANKQAHTVTGGLLPYTTYDTTNGHPFDIGLFKHWVSAGVRQTEDQVSVAPNWEPVTWHEQVSFGTPIPEDLWRVFTNSMAGYQVKLRKRWLEANSEDVVFTDPLTTTDVPRVENWYTDAGWTPANTYALGRIDSYEGVSCAGYSSEFCQHFLEAKFGLTFVSGWWNLDWSHMLAKKPAALKWHNASEGDPIPGDMLVMGIGGAATHAGICDGVSGNHTYMANSDHGGDRLGYYERVSDTAYTLRGWFRYEVVGGQYTYPLHDLVQPVTFHNLVTPLDEAPWMSDWMAWARQELNLDKPDGTNRPSPWMAGVDATLDGETWTIGAANGAVERTLASRRPNKYRRISAHLWAGTGDRQEVSYLWLLMTRPDLAACEPGVPNTGDDAKWHDPNATPWPGDDPGVSFEDITDWTMVAKKALVFSGVTADQRVAMTLHYQEKVTGSCPRYTGAKWSFGTEDGEASAVLGEVKTATITSTLHASDGTVWFDLCPDSPNPPLDLFYVSKVEFFFDSPAALTFQEWKTIPVAPGQIVHEVGMRLALKHSTDWFGARVFVDGMPNYKPRYLYTKDTERVEVGYKAFQEVLHNPDYEGEPDDPTYLKTLAEWYNEQSWAQTLIEPTYSQANIDRDLKDTSDVYLGTPVWGDYDEDGFCLHVGNNNDVGTPTRIVYCDCILQGGARGVAKIGGTRHVSKTAGIKLYYSDDFGTTKTLIREVGTGYAGEFRIGTGREKAPRRYWLNTAELGSFVNVEEGWYGAFILGKGQLHLAYHPVSGELLVTECGMLGNVGQYRIRNGPGWSERATVDDSGRDQTACTATNIKAGHLLIEGDGTGVICRTQTNLLGEWGAVRMLDTRDAFSWPIALEYQDRLFVLAQNGDGLVESLRFNPGDPNARWTGDTAASVYPTNQECAPAVAAFEDIWVLISAVATNDGVVLHSSNDMGLTWLWRHQVDGAGLHPAVAVLEHDLWLATYQAESYLGAQGRCGLRLIKVRGETWEAGEELGPFPCDEGRPAIFAHPLTWSLMLLVPKVTEWGLAGATPAIVEYLSRDRGQTFEAPVVHEVA